MGSFRGFSEVQELSSTDHLDRLSFEHNVGQEGLGNEVI